MNTLIATSLDRLRRTSENKRKVACAEFSWPGPESSQGAVIMEIITQDLTDAGTMFPGVGLEEQYNFQKYYCVVAKK